MEETTMTTEARPPEQTLQELVRPVEGRMLAGVAQGLANRYNLPVLLIRALFVILTFGGGLGLVLYAAGWFLIRSENEAQAPAENFFSNATGGRAWIGIGLVFLAVVILLDNFTFLDGGIVWAVGLLVVGILIYTGQFPGRSGKASTEGNTEGHETMTTQTPQRPTESQISGGGATAGGGVPPTPTPTPPILPPAATEPKETSYLGRATIGFMLLGVGILAALDNVPGVPIYPEPRHYMALAVTILGLGLVVGAFAGRARWLILVGVVLVPTLLFSPVFEWDWAWDGEEFNETHVFQTFDEVDASYSIDVGNLVLDLRELPWDGEEIEIDASVDAGNLEIIVPSGVAITGDGSVDVGRVSALGQESSGIGSPHLNFNYPGDDGEVDLHLRVDVGNIDVRVR